MKASTARKRVRPTLHSTTLVICCIAASVSASFSGPAVAASSPAEQQSQTGEIDVVAVASTDEEAAELERLIEERRQLAEKIRALIDAYNEKARSLIDEIER